MRNLERLRRVLDVQRRKRDHVNGAVARAQRALAVAERCAREASAFGRALVADVQNGSWSGDEFARRADLMSRAATDSRVAQEQVLNHTRSVEEKKAEAYRAERKVRTLEKVEERLDENERQEQRRAEQRETDEVAGRRSR